MTTGQDAMIPRWNLHHDNQLITNNTAISTTAPTQTMPAHHQQSMYTSCDKILQDGQDSWLFPFCFPSLVILALLRIIVSTTMYMFRTALVAMVLGRRWWGRTTTYGQRLLAVLLQIPSQPLQSYAIATISTNFNDCFYHVYLFLVCHTVLFDFLRHCG